MLALDVRFEDSSLKQSIRNAVEEVGEAHTTGDSSALRFSHDTRDESRPQLRQAT
jgi:hypothetical protein